jgi:fibronectin-binding autotransporter adhesin
VALAAGCDVACDGEMPDALHAWFGALGGLGTVTGNGNSSTITYNAGGFAVGADYRLAKDFLVGVGLGYATGSQWLNGFSGNGTSDNFFATVYSAFSLGDFYVNGSAGYAYNVNRMKRAITIPGLDPRLAYGNTSANQFIGQAEAGYKLNVFPSAKASVTPFAQFQASSITQAAFTEYGAGSLNLNVRQQATNSLRTILGAEFSASMGANDALSAYFRLGWAHEYADVARPVTASFAGAPTANFSVFGATPARDSAILSLSAATTLSPGLSAFVRYDGEIATGNSAHALFAGLKLAW